MSAFITILGAEASTSTSLAIWVCKIFGPKWAWPWFEWFQRVEVWIEFQSILIFLTSLMLFSKMKHNHG
jgi:hypothetical protein